MIWFLLGLIFLSTPFLLWKASGEENFLIFWARHYDTKQRKIITSVSITGVLFILLAIFAPI